MRLASDMVLRGIARSLQEQIGPALDDMFASGAARMAGLLATICANGVDDAAAVRIAENARLRTLFGQAAATIGGVLGERLTIAAGSAEPGYRISALDAETGRLRVLLVALHTEVEARDDDIARALDQAIWRLMAETEAARAPRD